MATQKEFQISNELKTLAETVIEEQEIKVEDSKIQYLLVYPNIAKTVAGRCMKTGRELKFFSDNDYLVEMSGELWDNLDEKTRYNLMHHELMHIKPSYNEKTGDWTYKTRPHDVEDFSILIKKHGIDWISNVKTSISSIYDMTPEEEEGITL